MRRKFRLTPATAALLAIGSIIVLVGESFVTAYHLIEAHFEHLLVTLIVDAIMLVSTVFALKHLVHVVKEWEDKREGLHRLLTWACCAGLGGMFLNWAVMDFISFDYGWKCYVAVFAVMIVLMPVWSALEPDDAQLTFDDYIASQDAKAQMREAVANVRRAEALIREMEDKDPAFRAWNRLPMQAKIRAG